MPTSLPEVCTDDVAWATPALVSAEMGGGVVSTVSLPSMAATGVLSVIAMLPEGEGIAYVLGFPLPLLVAIVQNTRSVYEKDFELNVE